MELKLPPSVAGPLNAVVARPAPSTACTVTPIGVPAVCGLVIATVCEGGITKRNEQLPVVVSDG